MALVFRGLDLAQVGPDHFRSEPERFAFSVGVFAGLQAAIGTLDAHIAAHDEFAWNADAADVRSLLQAEAERRIAEAGQ